MNRYLLFCSFTAVLITGCQKTTIHSFILPVVTRDARPAPYVLVEDFESGVKTAYKGDTVQLKTGRWTFDDALIGNLPTDVKSGTKSVRLRTGYLGMNFDISGLKVLYISHAKFGADASSIWKLYASVDEGKTYVQLGNDILETSATLVVDSFKVTSIGKIRFQIRKTGTTRVNLDDITFKGAGDPEILVGSSDTDPMDTAGTTLVVPGRDKPVAGNDAPPLTGDNSNLLMGNPSDAQPTVVMANNYLIDQSYYVESYSMMKSEPNWVSWHLDAGSITRVSARQNDFAAFSGLPAGWYQVQNNSYSRSGFDRGHNCPSADRTSSQTANSATFLMTNMIPQAPKNNQKTWDALENYLRMQVILGNEVYIIMGSYGSGGVGSASSSPVTAVDGGKVNVPSNVWKVALMLPNGDDDVSRVTSSTRLIAVDTPNINTLDDDWRKYIVSVKDIEQATGYNLLSRLPIVIQNELKSKKDSG